ncbi:hypothetical protein [Clostridium scatologenes]|uniref:Bacteriocin UviB n=1 Tax=Clostridium scatologenes TaxID=1548 RepID=A0A0E3K2X5_CLOSL|nr:hypothetical protein [Clostridium scatologenes]AKA71220.1 hypothetical protein CSCA_4095 [Clostridium scatologenes]
MDAVFMEILKTSPTLGVILIFWFYQRKDFNGLVDKVTVESKEREKNLQEVINKNQNIIADLAGNIKHDIEDIKEKVDKLVD